MSECGFLSFVACPCRLGCRARKSEFTGIKFLSEDRVVEKTRLLQDVFPRFAETRSADQGVTWSEMKSQEAAGWLMQLKTTSECSCQKIELHLSIINATALLSFNHHQKMHGSGCYVTSTLVFFVRCRSASDILYADVAGEQRRAAYSVRLSLSALTRAEPLQGSRGPIVGDNSRLFAWEAALAVAREATEPRH